MTTEADFDRKVAALFNARADELDPPKPVPVPNQVPVPAPILAPVPVPPAPTTPPPVVVPPVVPPPTPAPVTVQPGALDPNVNTLALTNVSGADVTDYPFAFGRVFLDGAIKDIPSILGLASQATVKNRYPSGYVKFAVMRTVVPLLKNAVRSGLLFVNLTTQAATPALDASALSASIALTFGGQTKTISAKTMLDDKNFELWADGPIASTYILRDHSAARVYDVGGNLRSVRPIFHATYWHTLKKWHIRAIGENCCTETLQDVTADVSISIGGVEVFSQKAVNHYAGTRWTRIFWIGAAPETAVNIDHNLGYLVKTKAFPNYDLSIKVSADSFISDNGLANPLPPNIGDGYLWQKDMGTGGGRADIGHHTGEVTAWLYTGDHRLFELVSKLADLAGAWPKHCREGDPARKFDKAKMISAIGLPVSVYARPWLWLFDPRGDAGVADAVKIIGPRIMTVPTPTTPSRPWGAWVAQEAHEPDPYTGLYLLTGDYFYLEQLQFWASASVVSFNPGYKKLNPSGGFMNEARGMAWMFRTRVNAAEVSPDGDPLKAYFSAMVDDAVCFWEGRFGIKGTKFEGTPLYVASANAPYHSPLHFWTVQPVDGGEGVDMTKASGVSSPWQHNMLIIELGIAKEKGYPTEALLSYTARILTSQFEVPGYDKRWIQAYWAPTTDISGKQFTTWPESLACYTAEVKVPEIHLENYDTYGVYACAVSSFITKEPGGQAVYEWCSANLYPPASTMGKGPTWAFRARA